jgi:hypothetical protein
MKRVNEVLRRIMGALNSPRSCARENRMWRHSILLPAGERESAPLSHQRSLWPPRSLPARAARGKGRVGTFAAAASVLLLLASPALAQTAADERSVTVENKSEPVLCAEKDNIYIPVSSKVVTNFRISAIHPSYIGGLIADRWAADWANCDFGGDLPPGQKPIMPERITLYEDLEWQLIGLRYHEFWRKENVPVKVGGKSFDNIHLVQVWMRNNNSQEEILVVYPPDGYWRARPLPPSHMKWTAYGSSFLVGPVEIDGRPIVLMKDITFDPKAKSFAMNFTRGGSATLSIAKITDERQDLNIVFSDLVPRDKPFAALRSMYVTEFNNDAARIAWRAKGAQSWGEAPIMDFKPFEAVEVWMGRHNYSRHNTSAPDMVFDRFREK